MSTRGLRFIKALKSYSKTKPNQFDSSVILSKITLQSLSDGCSRSTFKVDESMCNGGNTLHGGFIAACVDALSTFTYLGSTGKIAWTVNLHVDFIKAAHVGEVITVETEMLRVGRSPVMQSRLNDARGALVAAAATSLIVGADELQRWASDVYHYGPDDVD